jgi:hypothetical protein
MKSGNGVTNVIPALFVYPFQVLTQTPNSYPFRTEKVLSAQSLHANSLKFDGDYATVLMQSLWAKGFG